MNGLSENEVLKKQAEGGANEIIRQKSKTKLKIIVEIIQDPIIVIMFCAFILTVITNLKSGHFAEAYVILSLIAINFLISFIQEVKTVSKLKSLEKLNEDTVTVLRDSKKQIIASKELVVDDIVYLKLGSIARADMQVIEANNVLVDESFLTGESTLVKKEKGDYIYSNSPIQNGTIIARVTAIAMATEIGKIVDEVTGVEHLKSQLEIKILNITKLLMKIAFLMAIVIFGLSLANGQSIDVSFALLISILIATVPEGLATVLTIVLTFMASKMAKQKALVKQVNLLETLGEVSFVCSDKTGTITENKMQVTKQMFYIKEPSVVAIIKQVIDMESPTTRAISQYINNVTIVASDDEYKLIDELPFNSTNKYSLYLMENNQKRIIVAIGAPDVLVDKNEIAKEFEEYASEGLRTIVVAGVQVEKTQNININIKDLTLKPLCLFGIQDPPKESAIKTIKEFASAGISAVMITGDSKQTATSIAKQTGIIASHDDLVLTHEQLVNLSDKEFAKIVSKVKVYSRAKPEDKVRIVRALQANGEIVAMMGDGTNDSIALRQANVGIAMGINGTDISKDAADLILLDDNYSTIDHAIHGGRLIFMNLKKFVRQMLTSNTAHTSTILFALIFGLISKSNNLLLPMTPILILWINIVSDAIPCLALGLDGEEEDLMHHGPIKPDAGILTRAMVGEILLRGMTIGLIVVLAFEYALQLSGDELFARTIAFVVLSFGQLIHIFDARSNKTIYSRNPLANKWLLLTVFISTVLNLSLVFTEINVLFGLVAIELKYLLIAILISSIPTLFYSLIKYFYLKSKDN